MYLSKTVVIDTHTHSHTQTRCMLESWHIHHQQAPLNRDRGTLPGLHAALLAWPCKHLAFYSAITITNLCFACPFRLVGCLLGSTRLYPIIMPIRFILSPPPFFSCFFKVLLFVNVLVKLAWFLTSCTRIPHVTTSSSDCPIVFIHACL